MTRSLTNSNPCSHHSLGGKCLADRHPTLSTCARRQQDAAGHAFRHRCIKEDQHTLQSSSSSSSACSSARPKLAPRSGCTECSQAKGTKSTRVQITSIGSNYFNPGARRHAAGIESDTASESGAPRRVDPAGSLGIRIGGPRISPGLHQDCARIAPGLHQDCTRIGLLHPLLRRGDMQSARAPS